MITQSTAIGFMISPISGMNTESAVPPGRAILLLEDAITDAYLLETGDHFLLEY